ncbi:MAG: 30S ribosomal protein S7 [Anaerolineae bacterium]|nr:MAG: 30S ribosomal protein S7 [Anaerolineae bacterium]
MARRNRPEKRIIEPDVRFNDRKVQSFINRIMKDGKKSTAATQVYAAFDIMEKKAGKPGLEIFHAALKEVAPNMEVRPRRVGGATYQVPMEVDPERQFALATRWIITAVRSRAGKTLAEKLAAELLEAASGQGASVRKREETHKMAEANRAFSHYRV